MIEAARNEFGVGLLLSCMGHALLLYAMVFLITPRFADLGKPVVYSVTLEGGKTLGGISQVAATDKKEPVAPPKNVSAPEKAPEKEPEKLVTEDKKAEVSLAEKEKQKLEEKKAAEKEAESKKQKAQAKPTPKQPTAAEIDKEYQKAMQRYRGESTDAGGKGFGAGSLGGSGMGGGVLRPPEFFQYRDLLKATIKHGWRWYDTSASLTALVYLEMSREGVISNVAIAQSSGNREYDESVVRAVYKASPVPPPPASVYEFFEKVRIEFQPGD